MGGGGRKAAGLRGIGRFAAVVRCRLSVVGGLEVVPCAFPSTAADAQLAGRATHLNAIDGQPTTDNRQQQFSPVIIKRFEDLDVYQLAMSLQREIFVLSMEFPKEERYSLTDQIRRSSRSVGANLAEAWHKRRYPAHFASKLTDADAECAETRHWLQTSFDCGYLGEDPVREFIDRYLAVGAKLGHMIQSADQWVPR